MKDRIKKYMEYKNISAGELATLLEVQRSNISHILNGRNMPGAAFIEKFLISFPDLNARWLLTGIGDMSSDIDATNEKFQTQESFVPPVKMNTINLSAEKVDNADKTIDKVVLLFKDGTFVDYKK